MLMVLAGSGLAVWLGLVGLAVARKLRRDRRELRSGRRRAHYETVLRSADVAAITRICDDARGVGPQIDLAVSIDAVHPALSRERAEAVGRAMERSELLPRLLAGLGSRRPRTRARAALLLTRPGTVAGAVEAVAPLLGDRDSDVRLVACSGLSRAGTPRAAEILIWGLSAGLLPAERIIERLGAPWAVETILDVLRVGPGPPPSALARVVAADAELEASLARALGIAGDRRGAVALVELLHSDSEEVQVSAARALGRVGGAECLPPLIAALSSHFWPVRAQAAKALGTLRASPALGPLEDCLSDRAWWVRANAARALRELGEPGLAALRRALEHDDPYAADRAREQLVLHDVIIERVG
jgi:HEAT repeat protein